MPCIKDRKTGDFSQGKKKKSRVRVKEKEIRTKAEKKGKKTKKERRELVRKSIAPIDRLPSLPLQKSHLSPKNANENFSQWDYNHSGPTPSKPVIPITGFFLGDYLH